MIHNINIFRRATLALAAALLTTATAWAWSGEGTESSPYKISNADDFTKFRNIVNGTNGETRNTSAWGTLTTDIDMTDISCSPIGDNNNPYSGTFDGAGYTIKGVSISADNTNYISLFGEVADEGKVQGITLTSSNISGKDYVGGIAGMNWGTITNCHATNTVSVTGKYRKANVGGIVGFNGNLIGGHNGRVIGCTSAAGVTGTDSSPHVGGIVGNCNASTITNCIAIGAVVNSPYRKGAIVGNMSVGSTLSNNYYNGCKVNSSEVTASSVGIGSEANSSQKDAEGRAEPIFCVAAGDDVSMTSSGAATTDYGTNGIKVYSNYLYYNGAFYAKSSASVAMTLGHNEREGYVYSTTYSASAGTFSGSGSAYTLTMPDEDVIVSIARYDLHSFGYTDTYHPDGTTNPYVISDVDGWNVFCDCLQDNDTWNRFSGKTVRLGADITVTRMAGSSKHDFCGTFDGGGNTLTVNISSDDITDGSTQYVAPFRYVSNTKADPSDEANSPAAFRNLHVTGTITTDKQFTGGLIGGCWGTVSIDNCAVSTAITSTISGDGTHGGIVGIEQDGALTITGCVFDGSLLGATTYAVGGFLGYRKSGAEIRNSLFAPAEVTVLNTSGATFARNKVDTYNSYYTYYLCDGTNYAPYDPADADHPDKYNNGHATRTVAAAADVTIDAIALTGTANHYTVSGITAYSGGGLQRGETLYYGSGDQLSLTLSNTATAAPRGYQYGYTASAGTLSGTTLTMPDEDVTISLALAPIDWATVNQGNSKDPYMIYNKDQLLLLAHRVNGTNGETVNDYSGKYFKLGADITFDHPDNEGNDYAENYEAIGSYIGGTIRYFKGKFNGDGHTVSGIRIRKDGNGDADIYQGLFGCISSGADIYDVHLTDARIKGCESVGGIAGYNNNGYIMRCTVTDSYITATLNFNYGTICGRTTSTNRLTNNYYHGCTVNGTAVTSGKGWQGADITDNNGALPAYRLDLGANITTPPGTFAGQTVWLDTPPVSPRLAPENGFTLAGNHYFASGYVFTPGSTLASGAAQGYTPRATLGGQLLDLYTPTGDADLLAGKAIAQFTVTADCDGKTLTSTEAIYSTGQPVTVAYINADGTTDEASAIALDGTETSLAASTYFAGLENVNFDHTLNLTGDVNLILCDGCTMNVGTSGSRIDGYGIICYDEANDTYYDLTICGQTAQTGTLSVYTTGQNNYAIGTRHITVNGGNVIAHTDGSGCGIDTKRSGNVTINRGSVSATTTDTDSFARAINARGNLTINGGNVSAKSNSHAILANGNVAINGGTVNATGGDGGYSGIYSSGTITLGWADAATDRITASSYSGTVTLARLFTDASDPADNYYGGTYTGDALNALAGKTLSGTTEVTLTEDNATQALAAINGMSGIGVTFNRAFTASKPSTICLPFDYTKKEGDGSFYAFTSIEHSGSEYIATMTEPGTETLTANTPYLYLPSATGNVEFSGTPTTAIAAGTTTSGDWTFQGTYDEVKWDTAPTGIYGFSAQDVSDQSISQGEFVKVGAKVRIRPLRAYLKYKNGTENYSAARTRGTTADLPDRIIVRLIGSDGNTTAIGTLDTRTGEVEIDTWYDLNGRKLSAKPTHRGIYINNGRKVVIK